MKITITEIEATAEDLRANRTLAEALTDAIIQVGESIRTPRQTFTDLENENEVEEEA